MRDTLLVHIGEYNKRVLDFNTRCTGAISPDNRTLIAYCTQESAAIEIQSGLVDKERDRFLYFFHDYEKIYAAYLQTKTNELLYETVKKDSIAYNAQLQKLAGDISRIKVPPPAVPKKIHEGVMLGLFNTDAKNALTDTANHAISAWTGKAYRPGEIFATSDLISARELLRGLRDNNYLGEYTLSTEHGRKLVERLEGTQFDRLVAHSNGATVAEALIRKGVITVEELNIVGGDRSLINGLGYQDLIASGKVKRIVVWYNPGDLIPLGSSAAVLVSPAVVAKQQYVDMASSYLSTLLSGRQQGGDTKVEYRTLSGTQYKGQEIKLGEDRFTAHGLDTYLYNMRQFFKGPEKE